MKQKNALTRLWKAQVPFGIVVPAFLWQLLFFYLPLLIVFVSSFFQVDEMGRYVGLTVEHYTFFLNFFYLGIIGKSFLLAIANNTLCFVIGYPVAYYIAFRAQRFKNILIMLLMLPFWTNFLLHIYAWFFVLERGGFLNNMLRWLGLIDQPFEFLNSLFAVMLGMVYSYLPFMILPIYSVLEQLNKKLVEASLDLGATLWQTFRQVILPLSVSGIVSGSFLVFVPSFGEFAIPELMGGEKYIFVGNVMSRFMLSSRTMYLAAAFTVLSCLVLILAIALLYNFKQKY